MLSGRLATDERGFTLVEVLIAASLMIVVLGATLTSFNNFLNNNRRNNNQNDQQDVARNAVDQIVRQLRNLANPVNGTSTIAAATDNSVIFQTTDPNKQWVGYCLQTSGNGTSVSNGILWYQTYSNGANPNGTPPSTTCPDFNAANGWKPVQLVTHVTNANASPARPVFIYRPFNSSTPMTTPVASTATSTITRVTVRTIVDVEPNTPPGETTLSSAAYLRNQNQPPTASFTALHASGNTYTLDAGSSSDPEGRTLKYDWYEGQVPNGSFPPADPGSLPDCSAAQPAAPSSPWNFACVGNGPTLVHDFSTATTAFTQNGVKRVNVWLRVTDPGNLADVTAPSSGQCPLFSDTSRLLTQCEGLPIS